MDLNRLRLLVAAPMASLFLVLGLCTFVLQRPGAVGLLVPMLRVRHISDYDCPGVDRTIMVRLLKGGIIKINETEVPANELRARLAEIYENRQQKVLPVYSDPEVSFGDFATFYANVASSTSNLHIILRTRQLDSQLEQCPPDGSCGLDWPDHSYLPCVYRSVPLAPVRIARYSRR